jgi:hypothetical protein
VLIEELQLEHTSEQWRIYFDFSKVRLKTVLFQYGNKFPPIPLAYAVRMAEVHGNLQDLLQKKTP